MTKISLKKEELIKSFADEYSKKLPRSGSTSFAKMYYFFTNSLDTLEETVRSEIKELHDKSESRTAELQCQQEGYEYGLEDVLDLLKAGGNND